MVVANPSGKTDALLVGVFTERAEKQARETVRDLVLVSLASLALAGLASWVVAGRILRPVRLVRQTAAEISEQDLTRRIPVEGSDEISGMAATFNAMLDRLEDAFAAQRRFVDDAGHELRTPITVVRGHLELMGDDPVEREQTIALVTQELDRMARIVTDLLALAKADRPDFVRLGEPVDMAQLTWTWTPRCSGWPSDTGGSATSPTAAPWWTPSGSPRRCCSWPTMRCSTPAPATRSP